MVSASVSWPVGASKPLTWLARGRRSLTGFLPETTASRSLKITHPWDRYGWRSRRDIMDYNEKSGGLDEVMRRPGERLDAGRRSALRQGGVGGDLIIEASRE